MAKWKNEYTPIENINGGNEYEIGDVPGPEVFNTAVNNSNVAAQLGLNQPNDADANQVGTPKVEIETTPDGKKRFKFSNLKGVQGVKGNDGIDGANGKDGEFIYTFRVDENGDLIVSYDDIYDKPNFEINESGNLVYRNANTELNLGRVKGDNANAQGNILQNLGDSSSDTMSQRAITDALALKINKNASVLTDCNYCYDSSAVETTVKYFAGWTMTNRPFPNEINGYGVILCINELQAGIQIYYAVEQKRIFYRSFRKDRKTGGILEYYAWKELQTSTLTFREGLSGDGSLHKWKIDVNANYYINGDVYTFKITQNGDAKINEGPCKYVEVHSAYRHIICTVVRQDGTRQNYFISNDSQNSLIETTGYGMLYTLGSNKAEKVL